MGIFICDINHFQIKTNLMSLLSQEVAYCRGQNYNIKQLPIKNLLNSWRVVHLGRGVHPMMQNRPTLNIVILKKREFCGDIILERC